MKTAKMARFMGLIIAAAIAVGATALPSQSAHADTTCSDRHPDVSFPWLGLGMHGPAVTKLTTALHDYAASVPITDCFSQSVANGVMAFRSDFGLPAGEHVNNAFWDKLYERGMISSSPSNPASSASTSPATPTSSDPCPEYIEATGLWLEFGVRSDRVIRVEARLQEFGYFSSDPNHCYGRATADAVRAFQEDSGLVSDGIVGPVTWRALGLNGSGSSASAGQQDSGSAHGCSNPWSGSALERLKSGEELRLGHYGSEVTLLQDMLEAAGYSIGERERSCFGEATNYAVLDFERSQNDLVPDGHVDWCFVVLLAEEAYGVKLIAERDIERYDDECVLNFWEQIPKEMSESSPPPTPPADPEPLLVEELLKNPFDLLRDLTSGDRSIIFRRWS